MGGYNFDYNIGQKGHPKMHILFSFPPEEDFKYPKEYSVFLNYISLSNQKNNHCLPTLPATVLF